MAYSETSLCNIALMLIGAGRIQVISDTQNPAARACKALYYDIRDEVLTRHEWEFAKARKSLTKLSETPDFPEGWYYYQLPTDCLLPLRVENPATGLPDIEWEQEGDRLLCQLESDVRLHYTKRQETTALFSTMFVNCFTTRLSSPLAIVLKKDKDLAKSQLDIFETLLPTMAARDSKGEHKHYAGTDPKNSTFVKARTS